MQISEAAGGQPAPGAEPCRFPKLEECAHFHYERVRLPPLSVTLRTNMDQSLHSQHTNEDTDFDWYMIQVTSGEECWLLQRNFENFKMLDAQLHQCIYDRKISQLPDMAFCSPDATDIESTLTGYLARFSQIADNSLNCGPVLNWLQMDNKGHRLLVPSEESRSINTPAVAAAYSVRRYVSQARDELNLEVGDMISVIDMASPGESMWWRGKRGFQVGFFPQHCVHIIGDKVPRNMPLPPPVVGSLAVSSIKPVLRKHGKLITFFRSFILNRPSRRRLKQTGILKERVFACDLGEHLLNSGHEIPMVLKCCAEFIEKKGIVDGIYRLSGITSNIQKLRNAFDEDRIPNLYTDEILQDIHSVASLLKMYFRELPNPLCTYQLYQSFVNAVQNTGPKGAEGDHERLLKMREAVQKLPPPHYRTLEYLMRHLARVAKHGPSTGMTTRNVAIVWAPNLLRCAELEDGGVTALQGVGVQAVVTEFLICFADLIFCDHLPNLDKPLLESTNASPKKCRPKSLAISTPTKLITLEEARSKHLLSNRSEECNYIEVGGGPKNLPKKYHTIIELPSGARKRGHAKRSPSGWRSFFSKSRNNAQPTIKITRKSSTPGISTSEKTIVIEPEIDNKRKLRSVKSAESLTSGHSEPGPNDTDVLGPLNSLHKPPGHNRSISHDSYFDTLQNSQNNSEGSLLDLSEIQLNFDLEETEMRIFSEDESLVSSPKVQRESSHRRVLTRARPEDFGSGGNSGNPSPKKQPRVVLSPDSTSRKRTRLEDQLSDIQFIDCSTPDNVVSTTVLVHSEDNTASYNDSYQPKNKSPRSSDGFENRQSLNMSPLYRPLNESSANTTTESSPAEITYQNLEEGCLSKIAIAPTYENVLTTISITYKSPPRSVESSPTKVKSEFDSIYEDVTMIPEKAVIPTSTASLPIQQASQPELRVPEIFSKCLDDRPKSLSALDNVQKKENFKINVSSSVVYDTNEQLSLFSVDEMKTFSSNHSSGSIIQYTPSSTSAPYHFVDNPQTPTDLSLSEVLHTSTDNLTTSQTSLSFPVSSKSITPNVSPMPIKSNTQSLEDLLSPSDNRNTSECSLLQEIQSEVTENAKLRLKVEEDVNLIEFSPTNGDNIGICESSLDKRKCCIDEISSSSVEDVYQQVKYFRRSIHEINALLDINEADGVKEEPSEPIEVAMVEESVYDSLEQESEDRVYENMQGEDMKNEDKVSVKDLMTKFEENKEKPCQDSSSINPRLKKFYERDSLPPCLRARNLRNQIKTRSLDDEEFKKEFSLEKDNRRKSLDESMGYKTNSLPKTLNQPKALPLDGSDRTIDDLHMSHSSENIVRTVEEEMRKRERIEKYKEERRKILQEKYRTESFKEDKDVLLSRMKIYKSPTKEDNNAQENVFDKPNNVPSRVRRKSTRSDDSVIIEENPVPTSPPKPFEHEQLRTKGDECPLSVRPNSLKARAAVFERNSTDSSGKLPKPCRKTKEPVQIASKENRKEEENDLCSKVKRDDDFKNERQREKECEFEQKLRRSGIEHKSPRKDKIESPSYCIKDMKAIFESKSKQ